MKTLGTLILGSAGIMAITGLVLAILAAALSWAWNLFAPTFGITLMTFNAAFGVLMVLLIAGIVVRLSAYKAKS